MLPLVVALVLLPAGVAPSPLDLSEFEIVDRFLAPYDDADVQGDHCKRVGRVHLSIEGNRVPIQQLPPFNESNAMLVEHSAWHSANRRDIGDSSSFGVNFTMFHREMIAHYDAWRVENGFSPVEPWDPSTPVPAEFAYVRPGCLVRANEDPKSQLPTWATVEGGEEASPIWGYTSLCEFPSLNRFAKALTTGEFPQGNLSYHDSVHSGVAGDLFPVWTAPRDPLFYAWHKHLDLVIATWETKCGSLGSESAGALPAATARRDVPGAETWAAMLAAVGALLIAGRRR